MYAAHLDNFENAHTCNKKVQLKKMKGNIQDNIIHTSFYNRKNSLDQEHISYGDL